MEEVQLSSSYHVRPSATESLLYLDLAACAEQAGLSSVARQAYGQLLERSPRSSEARIRLGGLLARLGQVREATSVARRAIELDPASPRAHLLLSLLLEHQGALTEARTERDSSRALLQSRPVIRRPEPEAKTTQGESGDFTPSGPEEIDQGPLGLP
jgi:Flp pilus assembly protein TadD